MLFQFRRAVKEIVRREVREVRRVCSWRKMLREMAQEAINPKQQRVLAKRNFRVRLTGTQGGADKPAVHAGQEAFGPSSLTESSASAQSITCPKMPPDNKESWNHCCSVLGSSPASPPASYAARSAIIKKAT